MSDQFNLDDEMFEPNLDDNLNPDQAQMKKMFGSSMEQFPTIFQPSMTNQKDYFEKLQKVVEETAKEAVPMNSPYCQLYRKKHTNCKGCDFEVGCSKVSRISHLEMNYLALIFSTKPDKQTADHYTSEYKRIFDKIMQSTNITPEVLNDDEMKGI